MSQSKLEKLIRPSLKKYQKIGDYNATKQNHRFVIELNRAIFLNKNQNKVQEAKRGTGRLLRQFRMFSLQELKS